MPTPIQKPTSVRACSRLPLDAIDSPQPLDAAQYPPANPAASPMVTSGLPSPLMSPSIVTPPPASDGNCELSAIVDPWSLLAKAIVYVPGSLLVASIASRNEIPSGPGSAVSATGLDTFPLTASEVVVTVITEAAGADNPAAANSQQTANATTNAHAARAIGDRSPFLLRNLVLRTSTAILAVDDEDCNRHRDFRPRRAFDLGHYDARDSTRRPPRSRPRLSRAIRAGRVRPADCRSRARRARRRPSEAIRR